MTSKSVKGRKKVGTLSVACFKHFDLDNPKEKTRIEKQMEAIVAFAERRGFQCVQDEDECNV